MPVLCDRLRREHGGGLRILAPSPRVARLLRLTRLETLLEGASALGGLGPAGPSQRRVDPPTAGTPYSATPASSWSAHPRADRAAQSWSVSLDTPPLPRPRD